MLKNISNLEGAQGLTKKEQINVLGGRRTPPSLCAEPLLYCANERTFDPCAPITQTNYPC
jgi:hypothetical protein